MARTNRRNCAAQAARTMANWRAMGLVTEPPGHPLYRPATCEHCGESTMVPWAGPEQCRPCSLYLRGAITEEYWKELKGA